MCVEKAKGSDGGEGWDMHCWMHVIGKRVLSLMFRIRERKGLYPDDTDATSDSARSNA